MPLTPEKVLELLTMGISPMLNSEEIKLFFSSKEERSKEKTLEEKPVVPIEEKPLINIEKLSILKYTGNGTLGVTGIKTINEADAKRKHAYLKVEIEGIIVNM